MAEPLSKITLAAQWHDGYSMTHHMVPWWCEIANEVQTVLKGKLLEELLHAASLHLRN